MSFDPTREALAPGGGRPNHRKIVKHNPAVLDVICVISNSNRYQARYDLYRQFENHMQESGVRLTMVELAYGNRPFEVSESQLSHGSGHGHHHGHKHGFDIKFVQLRTTHELWHKENLVNIGISRLPRDWEYVAWVDADIMFARSDWAQETLQLLQHHKMLQLWSHAQDLGPAFEPRERHTSFGYCYIEMPSSPQDDLSKKKPRLDDPYYHIEGPIGPGGEPLQYSWHPGFAWAARREAIEDLGGLVDFAPLGAGDHHMAKALVGRVREAIPAGMAKSYYELLEVWQDRALRYIRKNIGYLPGLILHYWHGPKVSRRYWDRWQILVKNGFDPLTDLKRDWQGVWQLVDRGDARSIELRDDIRTYFWQRDEDATR